VGPTQLGGCTFEDALFEFDGPASSARAFLPAMSHPASGMPDIVKALFPKVFAH
jgi:hypothetical protein